MAGGKRITVGRVARTYGSSGELLITLFDTFPKDYTIEEPLFVIIDGLAVPLFCNRFERRGKNGALVVFSDLENERRAGEELLGLELYLESGLPEKDDQDDLPADEIYLENLIGWHAQLNTVMKGVIEDFIDGENPLFRVLVGTGQEVFIPAADAFIAGIDSDIQTVIFELPEGLLDLYQ